MNSDNDTSSKPRRGTAIGGWITFALGVIAMYVSVWNFLIYIPLFVAAFALAIVAMTQSRKIVPGLTLLLAAAIVPPTLWYVLTTTRINKAAQDLVHAVDHNMRDFQQKVDKGVEQLTKGPQVVQAPPPVADASKPAPSVEAKIPRLRDSASPPPRSDKSKQLQAEVRSLHAWEFAVGEVVPVDHPISANLTPAFSWDSTHVAVLSGADYNSQEILLISLHDDAVVDRWQPGGRLSRLAWSHDGQKLIGMMSNSSDTMVVYNRADQRSVSVTLPQPLDCMEMLWHSPDEVAVRAYGGILALNLDALQMTSVMQDPDPDKVAAAWQKILAKNPGLHPFVHAMTETDSQQGVDAPTSLYVAELDNTFKKLLSNSFSFHARAHASPDMYHVLVLSDKGNMHLFLERRPPSQRRFQVPFAVAKGLSATEQNELYQHLTEGITLWGNVYAPMINPLNDKVIGPNRKKLKGTVRVAQWQPSEVHLISGIEKEDLSAGDIVTDFGAGLPGAYSVWHSRFKDQWFPLTAAEGEISNTAPALPAFLKSQTPKPKAPQLEQEPPLLSMMSRLSGAPTDNGGGRSGSMSPSIDERSRQNAIAGVAIVHQALTNRKADAVARDISPEFTSNGKRRSRQEVEEEQQQYLKDWPVLMDFPHQFTVTLTQRDTFQVSYLLKHRTENKAKDRYFQADIQMNVEVKASSLTPGVVTIHDWSSRVLKQGSGSLSEQRSKTSAPELPQRKFQGVAHQGDKEWSFQLDILSVDKDGKFHGTISWEALGAIHEIMGRLGSTSDIIEFEETKAIKASSAMLGVRYMGCRLEDGRWDGTWIHTSSTWNRSEAGTWALKPMSP